MDIQYLKKKKLPESPGVYFFLDKNKKPIYIGKATSLRDRVKSYFSKDLISARGLLLVKMLDEARSIDIKSTDSVLEALLLEADLIKKFRPIYNTKEKDDKSFNCVVITKEDFPQVLVIRKKDIDFSNLSTSHYLLSAIFGPFPNSAQLKEALNIIRKIIPFRDSKCKVGKKPCFNYQIGLCPGTCIGTISKKEYKKQIGLLELFLSGDLRKLISNLEKEMKVSAKNKEFEKAGDIRNKIYALKHINDVSLIKENDAVLPHGSASILHPFRIEAYDIAHMSGQNMVGVMVVYQDGIPDKYSYRKFNIKSVKSSNDTASLKEIVSRRFEHLEWPMPKLIVVDGGIAQKNAVEDVLVELNISVPVVSVVKDEAHKAREILGDENIFIKHKKEIISANVESHRFALAFHKKKRGKSFLES